MNKPAHQSPEHTKREVANDRPNLSAGAFFFGCAVILVLVGLMATLSQAVQTPTIGFGSCNLRTDIARTGTQKAKGLGGRTEIPQDYAMVFPFHQEQPSFWMKGMLVPIDIVWVRDNKVVKVDANLPTDDGAINYESGQPVDWVVEVAANRASSCGVQPGTSIKNLHP